ncbi:MAG: hypothetical protein AAF633_02815, partial [Chloroflexota bacterium]
IIITGCASPEVEPENEATPTSGPIELEETVDVVEEIEVTRIDQDLFYEYEAEVELLEEEEAVDVDIINTPVRSEGQEEGGNDINNNQLLDHPLVGAAMRDLAERLSISPEEIALAQFSRKTWPNGAMGCERSGGMYTQALVDGHLIVLEANGMRYNYHNAGQQTPFLCENA